jgi:hypothetical protein
MTLFMSIARWATVCARWWTISNSGEIQLGLWWLLVGFLMVVCWFFSPLFSRENRVFFGGRAKTWIKINVVVCPQILIGKYDH